MWLAVPCKVCRALLRAAPHLTKLDLSENHIHGVEAWASIGHLLDAAPKVNNASFNAMTVQGRRKAFVLTQLCASPHDK